MEILSSLFLSFCVFILLSILYDEEVLGLGRSILDEVILIGGAIDLFCYRLLLRATDLLRKCWRFAYSLLLGVLNEVPRYCSAVHKGLGVAQPNNRVRARSPSHDIVVKRLRSGTVYGITISPVRLNRSDTQTGAYENRRRVQRFREKVLSPPAVLGSCCTGSENNTFGNTCDQSNNARIPDDIRRFGRPRSMLAANIPAEEIRHLGRSVRSRDNPL